MRLALARTFYVMLFGMPSLFQIPVARRDAWRLAHWCSGDDGGVPREFEFLPQMLHRRFGFQCHHLGKWHLGFKQAAWTPTHRGFLTSLGFYHWVPTHNEQNAPTEDRGLKLARHSNRTQDI